MRSWDPSGKKMAVWNELAARPGQRRASIFANLRRRGRTDISNTDQLGRLLKELATEHRAWCDLAHKRRWFVK